MNPPNNPQGYACPACGQLYEMKSMVEPLKEEIERLRTQLAAVEDTLSDLMTKYDALAVENVALREALKEIDKQLPQEFDLLAVHIIEPALSNPSPQVAKIEAVLEEAKNEIETHGDDDCACYCGLCESVRNLRGDK